jgi:hypothetical protein
MLFVMPPVCAQLRRPLAGDLRYGAPVDLAAVARDAAVCAPVDWSAPTCAYEFR